MPGCPSGQREQTVNLPAMPSEVQILLPAPGAQRRLEPDSSKLDKAGESLAILQPEPKVQAPLAQLAERRHGKAEVSGSNPEGGSERISCADPQ